MRGRDAQVPDGINAGNILAEGDGDALSIYCSERPVFAPCLLIGNCIFEAFFECVVEDVWRSWRYVLFFLSLFLFFLSFFCCFFVFSFFFFAVFVLRCSLFCCLDIAGVANEVLVLLALILLSLVFTGIHVSVINVCFNKY